MNAKDSTVPSASAPGHRVSRRIGAIAPSATLAVDAKAKAMKAAGRPVIGFGAGEPDFPTAAHIVEAAQAAAADPKNHRYSPGAGLPELREAVAEQVSRLDRTDEPITPGQVLITNGGKQAVYQTFATLLDPGDEVLLPAPFWTTYPEAIALAGGTTVPVLAGSDQGYIPTIEQLEAARTDRTTMIVLVSPSNPTGAVWSREQLAALGAWALEHRLWVVTDEIYQQLTYDDTEFLSILGVVPELADQTVVLSGVAKSYAMTGWRVGWMVGPLDVIKGASNLQSHLTSNVANVSQRAAIAALTGPQDAVATMREAFDRRRRLMVERLSAIPGIEVPVPLGAFYTYPDVSGVIGQEFGETAVTSSASLAELLLEQAEVAVVPGEAFGAPGSLRLSYALGDADLTEGIARIQRLLG